MASDEMNVPEDLSGDYSAKAQRATRSNDAEEMQSWLRSLEADASKTPVQVEPVYPAKPPEARPLPEAKPLRKRTSDSLGRIEGEKPSTAGTIMRNVAEIPGQAIAGVEGAVHHAIGWAIDPLANWLNDNVADLSYTRDAPRTATGAITKSLSEFLTGFVPALKGLRAVGMTGQVAAPIMAGAISDFVVRDPSEGRLSDLWKKMDLPKNVLTEYLSSKPDDTAIEARFKNAVESAGLGVATEGVMLGARVIRAAKGVRGAAQEETEYLRAKYGEIEPGDLAVIGDPKKPIIETVERKAPEAATAAGKIQAGLEGTATMEPRSLLRKRGAGLPDDGFDTYINFARFDEPDSVKFVIGKMADKMKGQIDEARRGVITQQETQAMAEEMGMTVPELLARRQGRGFNAEEAIAARSLWAESGNRLLEVAKAAASPNAGPLDIYAFRKMMAIHSAIQGEVTGARTETARALASWAIPVKGGGIETARAIDQVMSAMGGVKDSTEMARRLAILGEVGANPAAIARFAERGATATTMDAVKEVWVNGLLSSPKTHLVNTMSNTLVAFASLYERQAAGLLREFTGGEGVHMGEAAAMTYGMVESIKDAFRLAAKALKTGETGWSLNKVDLPSIHALSAEGMGMSRETGLGRFVDFLGTATRVPGRLLGAEDEFFKTIGYRMELRAQALRTASQEGNKGMDLLRRMSELTDNPSEAIKINSADTALYNTFTNEVGWFGRKVMGLRNADSPMNPMILLLPFVRTPVNLARFAFERTPFAPLVGQWRADIAAGGARADLALARMSTGTAIMLTTMDLADKGMVTGDGPKGGADGAVREALLRQGWSPYSMKVGDKWVSYNRTDPFGMTLGFAASITEAIKKGEISSDEVDEWQEVAAMAVAAVSQVTVSKTYLEGFAKFIEMMADPKRYGQKEIQDVVASFTPATALNMAVKNVVDPIQREVQTPMDAVYAKIAGLSDKLPAKRDLWGKEISSASGLGKAYDFLSPIAVKPEVASPIDREMVRLDHAPERIQKQTNFDGVQANMRFYPEVYDQ